MGKQITSNLLMIRPANFGFNPETAGNNAFQRNPGERSVTEIAQQAIVEFDEFVRKLREVGVDVLVVEDTPSPITPDAVFPNNWITTHADGTVVTYPMYAPTRRLERRKEVVEILQKRFRVNREWSLVEAEQQGVFLEGTGSMILDRMHRIVYACRSPRTDQALLEQFCREMKYEMVLFDAEDQNGQSIYHTNVLMALGNDLVVICLAAVKTMAERRILEARFAQTGKEVIEIRPEQMNAFAGNMLQVAGKGGRPFLVMSEQAYRSLRSDQVEALQRKTEILYSPLSTIETYGGGSARCMMAEIFLPEV
jgi:hypothetical protein